MGLDLEALDLAFEGGDLEFRGKKSERQERRHQRQKKFGEKLKKAGKKVGRAFTRVNPLTLAGRGGFLFILDKNIFGMATRLAPIFVADPKFTREAIEKGKSQRPKLEKFWLDLGGRVKELEKHIVAGYKKKPPLGKKVGFDGEYLSFDAGYSNFVVTEGMITAGSTVVASVLGLVGKAMGKNPYQKGAVPPEVDSALNSQTDNPNEIDPNAPKVNEDGTFSDPKTGEVIPKDEVVTEKISAESTPDEKDGGSSSSSSDKFLGMPKKVGVGVTIGVGVLLIAGIFVALARRK